MGNSWNTIGVSLPDTVRAGQIASVVVTTAFRGGFDGDNWNVDEIQGGLYLGGGKVLDREGCSGLSIGEFDASISGIPIVQFDPQSGQPFPKGFFSEPLRFSGQWSVPVVSDNSPAPVPAPSVLLLFGLALSILAWR